MSSKRELREQLALMRADVEAWRDTAVRFAASRDAATRERDAVFAELTATRKQRDAAVDAQYQDREELMEARARVTELEAAILDHATTEPEATPEPRPFRVGDRVKVAEGATFRYGGLSTAGGCDGTVVDTYYDGDIGIRRDGVTHVSAVSPEFCTLIEDGSEVVLPLPEGYTFTAPESNVPAPPEPTRTGVTLHTHDGRELWIPCEDPDLEEGVNGLWVVPEGRLTHSVAYVNPAAIVAAVVTR